MICSVHFLALHSWGDSRKWCLGQPTNPESPLRSSCANFPWIWSERLEKNQSPPPLSWAYCFLWDGFYTQDKRHQGHMHCFPPLISNDRNFLNAITIKFCEIFVTGLKFQYYKINCNVILLFMQVIPWMYICLKNVKNRTQC